MIWDMESQNCRQCAHKVKQRRESWTRWPLCRKAQQWVHTDYAGSFLNDYYALIIIDAYLGWPEVYLTKSANSDFTIRASRKTFCREGEPEVLITDNGIHFAVSSVSILFNSMGCQHVFTPLRHLQSNGVAKRCVRSLKNATVSASPRTFENLEIVMDYFLMRYRNAVHLRTPK